MSFCDVLSSRGGFPIVGEAAVRDHGAIVPHFERDIVLSPSATLARPPPSITTISFFLVPTVSPLLHSSLFLHHFFLTNTHQWPHSL